MTTKTKPKIAVPQVCSQLSLTDQGWTETQIRERLGEPDFLKTNPFFRKNGAAMKLYCLDRVRKAEAGDPSAYRDEKAVEIGSSNLGDFLRRQRGEELLQSGMDPEDVATETGATKQTVRAWQRRLGIPVKDGRSK